MRILKLSVSLGLWAVSALSAQAQTHEGALRDLPWSERLLYGIADTVIYALIGILMLVIAFKAKDILLPGNLAKQLVEDRNLAVAIVTAAFLLGISIIIAAVLSN